MPRKVVSTNGAAELIAGNPNATTLELQNNHATARIRYRLGQPVALNDENQEGFVLYPGGGCKVYTGTLAKLAVYAMVEGSPEGTVHLTWDTTTA